MNTHIIVNRSRAFVQKYFPLIWRIKDASNKRKMLERYYIRKKMTYDEAKSVIESDYFNYHGRKPEIENPTRYTEKIQYRKLIGHNDKMTLLSDKVLVRTWVEKKIGSEYLIPCLGVYDSFDQIDFQSLPKSFVLKTNHSSGWNYIVKDKSKINLKEMKHKFDLWLSLDYAYVTGFEMQYSGIHPKIICEQYMTNSSGELPDYKFLCFNGKAMFCWVDIDRFRDHRRNVYDENWELQPWSQCHPNSNKHIEKPKNYELMLSIANTLCTEFDHVRVDLYNVDGKVYFGEMTFTNGSGYEPILPDEYDFILGKLWK